VGDLRDRAGADNSDADAHRFSTISAVPRRESMR
jgi:hypothetical protein